MKIQDLMKTESWTERLNIIIYYNFHVFFFFFSDCCQTALRPHIQYQNIYSISRYTSFSSPENQNNNNKKKTHPTPEHVLKAENSQRYFSLSKVSSLNALVRWRRKGNSGWKSNSIYTCIHTFLGLLCLLLSNSVKKREWTGKKSAAKESFKRDLKTFSCSHKNHFSFVLLRKE